MTGGQVEILLDRAEPAAPAPWRTEGSGLVWVLDADAELPAADGPSLLPALATVGMDDASMLLDLEAFGVVALLGDPDACRGMATSFVTELSARNEGAVGIQIVGLDLGADLRGLDGVRVVDVWGDTDTEPIAGSARLLDAGRWPHTFAARASGRVFDGWSPTVWVTTHSDDPEYQAAVDAVAARPGTGSALVVVGDDPGCGLRIRLASNGRFTIPELGLTGRTQQLDAAVADHVVDLLADADSPEDVNDPCGGVAAGSNGNGERDDEDADSRPSVDDSSTVAEYHACTGVLDGMGNGHRGPYSDPSYRVLVRVCGELRVEGSENPLRQRETAIATYVALHGEAHIDQLRDAVWAGADVSRKRVQNVISKLRQDVGKAIRHVGDGRLAQGPGLITDLELIRRRLAFASHQTAEARATTLHEALQLVTGPVCTYPSTAARCWTWIDLEQWIPHTESIVGRLACDLAGLYLRLKDADSATWAARRGIEISGQREELVLLLVHAYELSGNQPAARAALESYERYATEYDIDEHSEAMVEALRRHLPARHH